MALDIWKMMSLDSVYLENDKFLYNLFEDNHDNPSSSISDIGDEKIVVNYLFTNPSIKKFILEDIITESGHYGTVLEVQKPLIEGTNDKPGDLDVLIIPKENEAETIAVEVKCFKAVTFSDKPTNVNKSKKVIGAFKQVNSYLKFGFHKVYFAIVLLDDARQDTTPNQLMKSSKSPKIDEVFWRQNFDPIDQNIGIVFIHLSQILNKDINEALTIKTKIKRSAIPRLQNIRTTDKIRKLLNEYC